MPLTLTAQEYRLLLLFAANPGQVLERGALLQALWDCGGNFVNDNTLTVTVKRLREKLESRAIASQRCAASVIDGRKNCEQGNKTLLLTLLAVSAAGGATGYLVCGAAGALCALMTGLLCCAVCLTVSLHRMREIHRLCDYLAQVYAGDRFLTSGPSGRGELSLLRNELYKVTAILWEQKECLSRDRQQMADFLGDVAHQLRTPLAAIVLQTELWQDAAVSQTEKTECAARIQQAAERMGWLVEQLLQLCRLDAKWCGSMRRSTRRGSFLREAARGLLRCVRRKTYRWSVWRTTVCSAGAMRHGPCRR